jgi:hypothetical protein
MLSSTCLDQQFVGAPCFLGTGKFALTPAKGANYYGNRPASGNHFRQRAGHLTHLWKWDHY